MRTQYWEHRNSVYTESVCGLGGLSVVLPGAAMDYTWDDGRPCAYTCVSVHVLVKTVTHTDSNNNIDW